MNTSRSLLREYLEALLIAVIFATFARTYAVQAFKIPTGSMEQNLLVGDHILVNKFVYGAAATPLERLILPMRPVNRGDVVVFKFPEDPTRDFIKRCIGLPGDEVKIRDKAIFINDRLLDDTSYTYHSDPRVYPHSVFLDPGFRTRDNFGPYTVPPGHFFFLGDNRDNSNDSRFWGPVPGSYIKGRAFMIYWSFADQVDLAGRSDGRDGGASLAKVFRNFFTHTRWERSFRIVR